MEEEKKEKGFVIKDRRLFDESGSVRKEEPPPKEEEEPKGNARETEMPPEETATSDAGEPLLPELNFASFIISLSTSAIYHFGDFPDPVTKEGKRNLPAAKQTIDILSILKSKTEGNLDENEKRLLDGILYELRMRFVKEMSK